jgi:hypothetical protein
MRNANERGERFDYNSRPDQQKSKMTQALDNLASAPRQKSKTRMAMERLIAMSGGDFEIPF